MKALKTLIISLIFLSPHLTFAATEFCYPEGCYTARYSWQKADSFTGVYEGVLTRATQVLEKTRQELANFTGTLSGYGNDGINTYTFENGFLISEVCSNSWSLSFRKVGCTNGASNPPSCNQCGPGASLNNGKCVCSNGASNSPQCNTCPAGLSMQNNLCVCANGATNAPACNTCPAGSNMINGQCVCNNNADIFQQCNSCSNGQTMNSKGQCVNGCTTTNACGQTILGYMNAGRCESNSPDANSSCIVNFNVTTGTVNPNGSVEFTWSLAGLPSNIQPVCGFVDLTTPTPRPIPGLQNLNPNQDKARINNIQTTTRFCLVCQFYNLLNNNELLGEAVKHQWVRVLRIGEN